jgi:hypothetical protein
MAATQSSVIDWQEAMQQCGDDEEFLREVLADLRTEVEAQLTIINEVIQVSPKASPRTNPKRSPKTSPFGSRIRPTDISD